MKAGICCLIVAAICLAVAPLQAGETMTGTMVTDYVIGPGDVLDVSVWKNPDLTKVVVVLPDGSISFPLIGEVAAGGKTVAQLKREMEGRIERYVPEPVLSVIVAQVNSMQIYVIGKVLHPGRFVLNSNVNVLQGLTLAGGLNPFAKRDKIKILRDRGGDTAIFSFDYDAAANDNDLQQNILLERGDVVVVP